MSEAKFLSEDYLGRTAGTALYPFDKYDYGISRDDTHLLREPCTSWSLTPDGDYPFLSVPDRLVADAAPQAQPGQNDCT